LIRHSASNRRRHALLKPPAIERYPRSALQAPECRSVGDVEAHIAFSGADASGRVTADRMATHGGGW
jgi:hypothetical protein